MAIFKILGKELLLLHATSFAKEDIKEREDLQRPLKNQINIISPDTLIIDEEFSEFPFSLKPFWASPLPLIKTIPLLPFRSL